MTTETAAAEIKKRWEAVATELVRRKRLDPKVYDDVVSTLARRHCAESDPEDLDGSF